MQKKGLSHVKYSLVKIRFSVTVSKSNYLNLEVITAKCNDYTLLITAFKMQKLHYKGTENLTVGLIVMLTVL